MGTHGRPVMGSHRPGPMGPSIVPSPPPGWPDVARSQPFLSSLRPCNKGHLMVKLIVRADTMPPSLSAAHAAVPRVQVTVVYCSTGLNLSSWSHSSDCLHDPSSSHRFLALARVARIFPAIWVGAGFIENFKQFGSVLGFQMARGSCEKFCTF